MEMPQLPEGFFWRVKRNHDSFGNPLLLQLRRRRMLGSTLIAISTARGRQGILDAAENILRTLEYRKDMQGLLGDYPPKEANR